jgi:hypothetical protein
MNRTCVVCNEEKELTEKNFRPHGRGREGFRHRCRKCDQNYHCSVWQKNKKNLPYIMAQSAKHRAKRDQVPFEITKDDIIIPERCPVFGTLLETGSRESHESAPSLDRIIPRLGYVRGNIRVISHLANMLKSKATSEQLRKLADYIDGIQPSITA